MSRGGFADVHNHQFAHLGFGGLAFHGDATGEMKEALGWCDFTHAFPPRIIHGPGGANDLVGDVFRYVYKPEGQVLPHLGHLVGGYPQFDGWPRWDSVTHQSVYKEWLARAVEGGLRLMVMLAVNNEALCDVIDKIYDCNDMNAADRQLQAALDFRDRVDTDAGGPGQGWYQIVTTPQDARNAMSADKLAVVLGIEVDFLFNCYNEGDLTPDELRAQLDKYYDLGVRHLFPIHFADNGFGGTGYQNPTEQEAGGVQSILPFVNWVHTEDGTAYGYEARGGRRNVRGLTDLGKLLIREMIARHMIIDVDHMSARSRADTLDICEQAHYPVVSGHTGFIDINLGEKRHEGQLTADEVKRIIGLGGMLSIIACQGQLDQVQTWRDPGQTVIEHTSGNTSNTTVQAYLYAVSKSDGGPVGFGTDLNGFAGLPGPRFGDERAPSGESKPPEHPIGYPFVVAATGNPMDQSVVGQKTFDFNNDGLAHVGLLPDLIADWQAQGLTEKDLAPLLRSASGYVDVWASTYARPSLKNPSVFDADFYLRHYPDLVTAFGHDVIAARNHWITQGLPKEGRRGSTDFDVQFYLAHNPDVRAAFGTDYSAALNHWIGNGLAKEGRSGCAEFDVQFYLTHYADLKAAFGGPNYSGAFAHWIHQGKPKEGRRGCPEFDVLYYYEHNPDVKAAYSGNNYAAALEHWVHQGLPKEGRAGSVEFDVRYYLEHNPDVKAAYGATNYTAALGHWFRSGLPKEGRRASDTFWVHYYLEQNPDLTPAGAKPNYPAGLEHWINTGKAEGRKGAP